MTYSEIRSMSDKEYAAWNEEFAEIVASSVDKVIALADKYNVDRDNAMNYFAMNVAAMTEISTFKNYEVRL